ncbi:uncharacterized protein LOC135693467 [Rhopilema esculentum]|uniref:uncharacterized protein LOC135693467 n=1 Tax=Rhopilema esculentum TaxID=499914 RepID=UPI0031D53886
METDINVDDEEDEYIVEEEGDDVEDSDDAINNKASENGSGTVRTEPKFIVFLSQLLLLLRVCHTCKADGLLTTYRVIGTMIEVSTLCANPMCSKKKTCGKVSLICQEQKYLQETFSFHLRLWWLVHLLQKFQQFLTIWGLHAFLFVHIIIIKRRSYFHQSL